MSAEENKAGQEYSKKRITEFKKAFEDMISTSRAAFEKSDAKYSRRRKDCHYYDKEEIRRIVNGIDPVRQAELSQHFFNTNGIYKRIILHYATFLTYSWILTPMLVNPKIKMSDKKVADAYFKASKFCTQFQVDRKCAVFAREVLVKGGYYGLVNDEFNGRIVIQDLPFEYCRSRFKNADDIDMVEFNVSFFDLIYDEALRKEILSTYPKIVQKAYNKYKYHSGPKWLFLPAKMGIYFNFFEERPFFLDIIPLLDDLDDYKDIDKARNMQALKKILVQQVKIDGMKLVFEPDEAEEMHNGALQMLANNPDVDVLTTYNDVDLLDMSADEEDKTEIEDVLDNIYQTAGLSSELFSATSEVGINYSINNDLSMMMILGKKFAHFFTCLINYRYANKKTEFELTIMPICYYNAETYSSKMKDLAAFGYAFLPPVLATGIDQTNLVALKSLENDILNLDEVLKPLESTYTQSNTGAVSSSNNGKVTVKTETQSEGTQEVKSDDE